MRRSSSRAPRCCCSPRHSGLGSPLAPGSDELLRYPRGNPTPLHPPLLSAPSLGSPRSGARLVPYLLIYPVPFSARSPGLPPRSADRAASPPSPPRSRVSRPGDPQPLFQPTPTAVPAQRASASPVRMAGCYLQHRNNNNNNYGNNSAKWRQQPRWCSRAKADSKGNLEKVA